MRQNFPKSQAGMGASGWLFALLIFGGAMSLAMQLVPLYVDHNTMSKVLDGLSEDSANRAKRNPELRALITQRFRLNNVRDFPLDKNLVIDRSKDGVELILDYEVRIPLINNIDLIASFNKSVELRN